MKRTITPADYAQPRWTGPLGQLIHALTQELGDQRRGTWRRRELARGAVVSLSRREDGRRLLLLSRPYAPKDPERGLQAWQNETLVFLNLFGAMRWAPTEDLPELAFSGLRVGIWSAFLEPPDPGEAA